jgi:NADH-ubiquinone oxidoreductase chain 2
MDVYEAVATRVTAFISTLPKISLFIFMLSLVHGMGEPTTVFHFTNLLLVSSLLSLIIGTVVGLVQIRIKRLLAFSSISHVGFMLLALAASSQESIQAFLFYLMQYSLTNINIFFIIIAIGYTIAHQANLNLMDKKLSPIQLISQLNGYFYVNPLLAISFAIALCSLIGVPPLIGFVGKQLILTAALSEGYYFLVLVGILTSVVGAVYYLHIIKVLFFNKPTNQAQPLPLTVENIPSLSNSYLSSSLSITISSLTLVILLFMLSPQE